MVKESSSNTAPVGESAGETDGGEKEMTEAANIHDTSEPQLFKHISVCSRAAGVPELQRCTDDVDCGCNRFHCPLCVEARRKPCFYRVIYSHLETVHVNGAVTINDHMMLRCALPCDPVPSPRRVPELHFHCMYCGKLYYNSTQLVAHINSHMQPSDATSPQGAPMESQTPVSEILFPHPSLLPDGQDLAPLPTPDKKLFRCQLCLVNHYQPQPLSRVTHHHQRHTKNAVQLQGFRLLLCHLDDHGKTAVTSAHYHCPYCGQSFPRPVYITQHIVRQHFPSMSPQLAVLRAAPATAGADNEGSPRPPLTKRSRTIKRVEPKKETDPDVKQDSDAGDFEDEEMGVRRSGRQRRSTWKLNDSPIRLGHTKSQFSLTAGVIMKLERPEGESKSNTAVTSNTRLLVKPSKLKTEVEASDKTVSHVEARDEDSVKHKNIEKAPPTPSGLRPRGRPPKSVEKIARVDAEADKQQEEKPVEAGSGSAATPRRRGRPPKQKPSEGGDSSRESTSAIADDHLQMASDVGVKPKLRGRPPKVPTEVELNLQVIKASTQRETSLKRESPVKAQGADDGTCPKQSLMADFVNGVVITRRESLIRKSSVSGGELATLVIKPESGDVASSTITMVPASKAEPDVAGSDKHPPTGLSTITVVPASEAEPDVKERLQAPIEMLQDVTANINSAVLDLLPWDTSSFLTCLEHIAGVQCSAPSFEGVVTVSGSWGGVQQANAVLSSVFSEKPMSRDGLFELLANNFGATFTTLEDDVLEEADETVVLVEENLVTAEGIHLETADGDAVQVAVEAIDESCIMPPSEEIQEKPVEAGSLAEDSEYLPSIKKRYPTKVKKEISDEEREKVLCPACGKSFVASHTLISHWLLHAECLAVRESMPAFNAFPTQLQAIQDVPSKNCPRCQKSFPDRRSAAMHYARFRNCNNRSQVKADIDSVKDRIKQHPKSKLYMCDKCAFKSSIMCKVGYHILRRHTKKSLQCRVCDKAFSITKDLEWHVQQNHSEEATTLVQCGECGKEMQQRTVKQHMKYNHSGIPKPDRYEIKKKELNCPHCDYKSFNRANLRAHVKGQHGERNKMCDLCGKAFSLTCQFNRHRWLAHQVGKPVSDVSRSARVQCPICDKELYKKNLKYHLQMTHNNMKKFACDLCSSRFTRKASRDEHMFNVHGVKMERPQRFLCKPCNKGFYKLYDYREHMRKHSDQRDYVCVVCWAAFKRKLSLRKHMEAVHGGSETPTPDRADYKGRGRRAPKLQVDGSVPVHHQNKKVKKQGPVVSVVSEEVVTEVQVYACLCGGYFTSLQEYEKHECSHMRTASHTPVPVEPVPTEPLQALLQDSTVLSEIDMDIPQDGESFVVVQLEETDEVDAPMIVKEEEEEESVRKDEGFMCGYCSSSFPIVQSAQEHILDAHKDELDLADTPQYEFSVSQQSGGKI